MKEYFVTNLKFFCIFVTIGKGLLYSRMFMIGKWHMYWFRTSTLTFKIVLSIFWQSFQDISQFYFTFFLNGEFIGVLKSNISQNEMNQSSLLIYIRTKFKTNTFHWEWFECKLFFCKTGCKLFIKICLTQLKTLSPKM